MKKNKYSIMFTYILLSIFLITSTNFAQNFEGKVKFKMTHGDNNFFIDYFLKGEDIRIEFGNNKETVFIKNKDQSVILMTGKKMYMDLDNSIFKKIQKMAGMNKEEERDVKEFDIKKYQTGKTKTILGYECAQWIIKDSENDSEVEAWVTDELGNFMLMKSPMGGGFSPGWGSSLKNNGFFPILVITRNEDGKETSRFEATDIDKQTLSGSLFVPPSDFNEMKIPGF